MKKEDALVRIQDEVKTISENVQEVERFTREINRYTSSGKSEELESNKSKIDDLKEELSKEEQEESNLKKTIDQLKEDIVGEEVKERELYDNIQLKKKRSEVDEVNGNLKNLEEQRGSMDSTGLVREKHRLNNKLASLFKERNQADGRQSVLKEEVKKIETELNSEKYRTAEEKFTDVMIKLKTLEVTNKDLDKYSKALDTAIMKYHKLKMEEINKIIKEYWRMTYKGNDIDYIEIRSEADTSVSSTTTRKSYNYRVVMVKGDTEMDMRGRCSAGQKVLASLIIRLALAETFCLSCGILALDEPTTNLDRVNIEGLAHALVDIIKSRESQRNFQLIVITHDEDFVELLGRSDYADYFYRVTKNNE
ncbi:DNA repair protein RAD50 [Holothuria leucospilota]|uniref:DNA repair protein RAD50 n=1 Tax=Holothuria leucospilota TaxID=206669 RepID=A0A9Q1H050_HOLLE|nr:DNA repair protein RAD50 [Holothuria leucospilota]